jgi:hypothetical protein
MSKLDWDRKGSPRPGSSSIDHPPLIQRPLRSPQEREKRKAELLEEAREREYRSILHDIELAGPRSPEWLLQLFKSRKRQKLGLRLTTLDKAMLEMDAKQRS